VVAPSSSCCCCLKGNETPLDATILPKTRVSYFPPFTGQPRGPQLVWLLCLLPRVEPHFVPPYMDGWQVFWVGFQPTLYHFIWTDDKFFGLGFNPLCTTLYGWMTSFFGWVSTHFVPLYMDGWQVFGLGFQLTLYHFIWMYDKFLGWVNCLQVGQYDTLSF
jgi:hypothetical protein